MSNRVYFQTTKFTDLNNSLKEVGECYGYRIYDDYESYYDSFIPTESLPRTAKEAFELIKKHDSLHEAVTLKGSFHFNDEYIELNEDDEVDEE